jgi:hypothetical protein
MVAARSGGTGLLTVDAGLEAPAAYPALPMPRTPRNPAGGPASRTSAAAASPRDDETALLEPHEMLRRRRRRNTGRADQRSDGMIRSVEERVEHRDARTVGEERREPCSIERTHRHQRMPRTLRPAAKSPPATLAMCPSPGISKRPSRRVSWPQRPHAMTSDDARTVTWLRLRRCPDCGIGRTLRG